MTKKIGIRLALAVIVIVGGVAWQALHPREPVYQGKPLTFWLKGFELDSLPGKPTQNEAVEAVRQAGTNAFPTLLRMLRARDSDLKHRLTRLAQNQHFIEVHYVTADSQRWLAREGFVALGRVTKFAIPQLVEIHEEEIYRAERNKYTAEILELLKERDKDASEDIAKALKKSGPGAAAKAAVK